MATTTTAAAAVGNSSNNSIDSSSIDSSSIDSSSIDSSSSNTCREKLLLAGSDGIPVVMRAIGALRSSGCIGDVVAAVSPNSPGTRDHLRRHGVGTVQTPGLGYSRDLAGVLRQAAGPVLVVSGDMPLLDGPVIREAASRYNPGSAWTCVVTTAGFRESRGLSPGVPVDAAATATIGGSNSNGGGPQNNGGDGSPGYEYTGISLVNADMIRDDSPVGEHYTVMDDQRVALDLNTRQDCMPLGIV